MAFDKLTQGLGKIKDKVGTAVNQNRDKIDSGIDKAGTFIKDKTGNKHDDKIEAGENRLRKGLDSLDDKPGAAKADEPKPGNAPAADAVTPDADAVTPDTTPDTDAATSPKAASDAEARKPDQTPPA